jgi:hypothetical protein
MVNLRWNDNLAAARRLEELWNEMIDRYSISLLCTYALPVSPKTLLPRSILDCHSVCIGHDEPFVYFGDHAV